MGQTMQQHVFSHMCASGQSDQDLRFPLTESLDTTECINGEQIPDWDFANVWDESQSLHLRMLEDTFLLGPAYIVFDKATNCVCWPIFNP